MANTTTDRNVHGERPAEGPVKVGFHLTPTKVLAIVPVIVCPVFLTLLHSVDEAWVFDPPLLLVLLNTVFLGLLPFAVVYVSTLGYLASGSASLVLLGGGALSWGVGSFLAALVLPTHGGPNAVVTLHNCAALVSAAFHLSGAASAFMGVSSEPDRHRSTVNLILAYSCVLAFLVVLAAATLHGMLPVFFVQGEGPTLLRQMVLGTATAIFIASGVMFFKLNLRSNTSFMFWYSMALFLISAGLLCIAFQKSVGSPVGWLGRSAQYLAGVYLLVAVMSGSRELRGRGATLNAMMASIFKGRLAALVDERTAQLAQTNILLRSILSSLDEVVILVDPTTKRIRDCNDAAERILGYSREEMIGQETRLFHVSEETFLNFGKKATESCDATGHFSTEYRMRRKNGEIFPSEHYVATIRDDRGKIHNLVSVVRDTTERKRAEQTLVESEKKYRALYEGASDGIFLIDDGGTICDANSAALRMYGYSLEEIKGTKIIDLIHPEDLEAVPLRLQSALNGEILSIERRIRRKDGTYIAVEVSASLVGDKLIQAFFRDMTQRKQAEATIREQKEFLDTVIESLTHPFYVIDTNDYTIEKANSAAIAAGVTPHSMCFASTHHRSVPCTATGDSCPMEEAKRTGRPVTAEHVHYDAHGQPRYTEVHCFPVLDGSGQINRAIEYCLDVTDRKKAQEIMLQTEKFRAVADLTSGVAHNFNNLLQIVIGNASLGLMNLQSADFIHLKENLTRIAESARFGAETVRRLNRYARSRDDVRAGETEVFDLSDLVRQAAEMTRHWWKTEPERKGLRVSLDTRVKTGCTIRGNKTEIFEVVVNLIKNAVEALPLGGDIEIDTGMEENMVVLKVRDNGTGIPRENLSRLFTPFFTTHVDAGRGLGLATTRTIIDSHGGQILVESAEGQGSTFTVTLPLVIERPVPQAQAEENGTDMVLNILAVDDLEATLKMMKAGLEAFGHTVFTAVSGDDAVKIFSNNEIDLVICDLGMPGMNGWQVGSSVTKIRREKGTAKAAFIILTGWDEQAQEDEKIKESGVDAVVRKPIDITRLMKVIREVMARERYGQR